MVFGVRIPKVARISTRGISVGPSFAKVRVGRGGIGASVGPRIARVHVSNRGVGASTGVGPVSISPWGARASFGAGPLRGSLGTRGAGAAISAGPFWLGTSTGGKKSKRSASTGRSSTASGSRYLQNRQQRRITKRPTRGSQYRAYRSALTAAGIKKRNRAELELAAVTSLFLDWSSVVAWAQTFPAVVIPGAPPLPREKEIRSEAKLQLKQKKQLKLLKSNKAAIDAEFQAIFSRLTTEHTTLTQKLREAQQRIDILDPFFSLLVLQAAFADNGVPAIAFEVTGTKVNVLLLFPTADEMVWPETISTSNAGQLTVKNRTKAEIHQEHARLLVRYMFATAKETLSVLPNCDSVQVIAINDTPTSQLSKRLVIADITLHPSDLKQWEAVGNFESQWWNLVQLWEQSGNDSEFNIGPYLYQFTQQWGSTLTRLDNQLFVRLMGRVGATQNSKGEIVPHSLLGDFFPDIDLMPKDSAGNPQPVEVIADNPRDLDEIEFWLAVLELSKQWRISATQKAQQRPVVPRGNSAVAPVTGNRPTIATPPKSRPTLRIDPRPT
jgi:hypothetical protein